MNSSIRPCLSLALALWCSISCTQELSPEPAVVEEPSSSSLAPQASGPDRLIPEDLPGLEQSALGTGIVDELEALTEFEGVEVQVREMNYPSGRLRYRKHVRLTPSGAELDHGPDWRWWENGQIKLRRVWREAKAEGDYLDWHKSGFQKSVGALSADRPVGVWKRWYGTGEPKAWEEFADGVRDGLEVRWHKTGAHMHQKSWSAGVENGLIRQWGIKGALLVDGVMVNGQRDGLWREWWSEGGLQRSSSFKLGKPDGIWSEFYEAGGGRVRGSYLAGFREGRWEAWLENGQRVAVEHFVADLLDGERSIWGEAGVLLSRGSYVAGVGVGVHEEWSPTGALIMRRVHDDPPGADHVERWWPNDEPRSKGLFVDGKRDGRWMAWSVDGLIDLQISGLWRLGERVAD